MNVREREGLLPGIACQNKHPQGLSSLWRICNISLKQMEIKMGKGMCLRHQGSRNVLRVEYSQQCHISESKVCYSLERAVLIGYTAENFTTKLK